MEYYHMTSIKNLKSISENGLVPNSGKNSILINDKIVKVFFSEGFEGTIALFVDFDIVYNNIKNKITNIGDREIENEIYMSNNLEDYLGDGVYLRFDGTNIRNERNFENGCTGKVVQPEEIYVCTLRRNNSDIFIDSRFEVVKFMMAKTNVTNIKYYDFDKEKQINPNIATERIQKKVNNYYKLHRLEIDKYKNEEYIFECIPLKQYVK